MQNVKAIYERRVKYYSQAFCKLGKSINTIGNFRLLAGIVGLINGGFLLGSRNNNLSLIIFMLSVGVFIYLVRVFNSLKMTQQYIAMLEKINGQSIQRVEGTWIDLEDRGDEFKDEEHPFSSDLDIFGRGSLFQWVNRCTTYVGRVRLARLLSEPEKNKDVINQRQEALQELSRKRWWRQRLQAEGMRIEDKSHDKGGLINWAGSRNEVYSRPWLVMGMRVLPMVTVTTFIVSYFTDFLPVQSAMVLLVLHILILLINVKQRSKELNPVYQYKDAIRVYTRMLAHVEKEGFTSDYLKELKNRLRDNKGLSAVQQLKRLEVIADRILNRNNLMFFPINILILWDYQCMIALEAWKRQSGGQIQEWLEVVGEIEALSSLANIGHDYPQWSIPEIVDEPWVFQGKAVGHPLLTNKQVCNDVDIKDPSRILLITGSNMSGKSTLLRTLGINLVLAYMGTPVCASSMKCSLMEIHTCMRISDNLEKNISSFYGELLRIKKIVKASKENEQVFFLIDEVFKGTNSHDRHIGAKTLIKQLYEDGAMGLISTHDLELGEIEKDSHGNIKNYHFQEHYKDNQIYFDYRLRPGISTTRNALYLIKMAGIEIDSQG
ncbi:DNA mismatch repair protein MutS domain protein [Alkaliphilus metalliredigens QYMF]|uniref:DNA mismatch repair protein MutS domain protein n=1 Tax=Alkaliphilus metalliredigens (strain QYMF) TaxID=293826 RepID=A6TX24_ALKMQ|nr:MutS family DNA mismatch repair protein [Alkaliphilus metalliredigens]ABR50742.1 DNA mismatch repair protein MutS domain protein [Alkaliphilus metalliredigens QYMF]